MFYPKAGALRVATVIRTELADSEVRLFKYGEVTLSPDTTLAELDAAQCDFTGYAAEVIADWDLPVLSPVGGASIGACVQFQTASPFTVGNVVGGFYIVDTTGSEEVLLVQAFPDPGISMASAGDGIPLTLITLWGTPTV